MILYFLFTSIIFLGLTCCGSFLVVVGERTIRNESFIFGRSHCNYCQKNLNFLSLIPILGYLFYQGRCHHCKNPIKWLYPILEGYYALSILVILHLDFKQTLWFHIIIFSLLFIMAAADIEAKMVPDRFQLLLLASVIVYYFAYGIGTSVWLSAAHSLFIGILLVSLSIATAGGMGGADIKVFMTLTLFYGWYNIFLLILITCVISLFFLGLSYLYKQKLPSTGIALLPFITLAYPIFLCMLSYY